MLQETSAVDLNGNRDPSLMTLGRVDAICLFVLYLSVLLFAGYRLAMILIHGVPRETLSEQTVVETLTLSSLCGASIFYARKLYKAGINKSYDFEPDGFTISRISTIAYFVVRLPASALFSIVLYCIWRVTLDLSTSNEFNAPTSSRYLFLVMGFFAGFSSGKFMAYFEKDGMSLARSAGGEHG